MRRRRRAASFQLVCTLLALATCLGLGQTAFALDQPAKERRDAEAEPATAMPRFDPEPLLRRAHALFDGGQVLESLALYEDLARLTNDDDYVVYCLVRVADALALFLGRESDALAYYDRAITGYPGNWNLANAYFNSGMLLYGRGQLVDARLRFKRYLELFPNARKTATARYMVQRIDEEAAGAPGHAHPELPELVHQEPTVRVLLAEAESLELELPEGADIAAANGRQDALPPGRYRLSAQHDAVSMEGRELGEKIAFAPDGERFVHAGRDYAGEAIVIAQGRMLLLVNRLPLEAYLDGVLPAEMPPSFAPEALAAQAVAARTFAWRLLEGVQPTGKPYDLTAGVMDQAYVGMGAASPTTREAVRATRGRILRYDGETAFTAFHAHSGGRLEDDAAVWAADMPYLAHAADPVTMATKPLRWGHAVDSAEMAGLLARNGFQVRRVRDVRVRERTASGRIARVEIITDAGEISMHGNSFRLLVGAARLKSLLCDVRREGSRFVFTGQGYGHGVGLSQWGAQGLALQGAQYPEILDTYYPRAELHTLYP